MVNNATKDILNNEAILAVIVSSLSKMLSN